MPWFAIGSDCLYVPNLLLCHWPSTKIQGSIVAISGVCLLRLLCSRTRGKKGMNSDTFVSPCRLETSGKNHCLHQERNDAI